MEATELVICVCTYKRAEVLACLAQDILGQSLRPATLIIVDGDPASGEALRTLESTGVSKKISVCYIPSNHSNLAYQRYLGWRTATQTPAKVLLYLDDDLRITDRRSIERLVEPLLLPGNGAAGVTGNIAFGAPPKAAQSDPVTDRSELSHAKSSGFVRWFGSARGLSPGSLTPAGDRCPPGDENSHYAVVEWLRGGVMACRLDSLDDGCFSMDLFGLCERGYGHGEDTLFSRRLGRSGRLLMARNAPFLHPSVVPPSAYSTRALHMGYGTAYSRRLLNDNYRWPAPPKFLDRMALSKSYAGNVLIYWCRAIRTPRWHRFAYAWGYTWGALMGLVRKPTANRLTPGINWREDADRALIQRQVFKLQ